VTSGASNGVPLVKMRTLTILALVAVAAGLFAAGSGVSANASGQTALTITYWANGDRASDRDVWTLRCHPPRGTHPRAAVACRRIQAGGWKLVAPVPAGTICTEIYGGPQVARVAGLLEGRRVFARFTRVNGCQIARWNKLAPWLFPAGGVTG
jgi:hypothetical protein